MARPHDLGYQRMGTEVVVSLSGDTPNVRLLDDANYTLYLSDQPYLYTGGMALRARIRLTIPHDDHWHLAVDPQGADGTAEAMVEVLPRAA